MAVSDATASRLQIAVQASGLRAETIPGVLGMTAVAGVLVFLHRTFAQLVDPTVLVTWLVVMALCPLIYAITVLARVRNRPNDAQIVRFWQPLGLTTRVLLDLGAIVGIWILFPVADPPLMLLLIVLYVWFLATQMMVSHRIDGLTWIGPVGIAGSLIVQVLRSGAPQAVPLAVILGCIGLTLFALGRLIMHAKTQAMAAKALSEQAATQLRETLATVAAERDAKTRFIAVASHDLQQPLQAAQLFFETAVAGGEAAARERAAAGVRRALASTQALVAQMLDHLRLEAGAVRARLEVVSLGPLLIDLARDFEAAANTAGMRLIVVPGRQCAIADAALLRGALGNLIANAIRHAQGKRVLIGVRQSSGSAVMWVIDDGVGVAATDTARLFEDFAQGDHGDAIRGGFGLGLASVRRSLALMGGTAGLDARWVGGAAFFVALPAARPVPAAAEVLCEAA